MKPAVILRTLPALLAIASFDAAAAQDQAGWSTEEDARWDFENALRMWSRGQYGGLLFYHGGLFHNGGGGALSARLQADMESGEDRPKPAEWTVTSVDCPAENECSVTTLIRFTDEPYAGLRRYRLVIEPGHFWGLIGEEMLECPGGYRLHSQGTCVNETDEQSDDLDVEVRTADPVVAD